MKHRGPGLALLLAAFLLLPRLALAQRTPEAAAERYFQATRSGDWAATAALMHPRALEQFKAMFADLGAIDRDGAVFTSLFGVKPAELGALPAAQVYERVFGRFMGLQPEVREIIGNARFEVVGHVMEGETAHVVYRMHTTVAQAEMSQTSVVSLARDGGEWKPLLTGDMQGLFAGLRRAMLVEP